MAINHTTINFVEARHEHMTLAQAATEAHDALFYRRDVLIALGTKENSRRIATDILIDSNVGDVGSDFSPTSTQFETYHGGSITWTGTTQDHALRAEGQYIHLAIIDTSNADEEWLRTVENNVAKTNGGRIIIVKDHTP